MEESKVEVQLLGKRIGADTTLLEAVAAEKSPVHLSSEEEEGVEG